MKRHSYPFLQAILLVGLLLSPLTTARAQDATFIPISAEELMADVLDLSDPVLSIWPEINAIEVASLKSAVGSLQDAYEANRLDADERTREIEALVAGADRDVDAIKDLIKKAKDADNDDEKDRLEDLKDYYEMRQKYLERVAKVRAAERELAEAWIDYINQLTLVLELTDQMGVARSAGITEDMLGTERELIRQTRELGDLLDTVGSRLKKVGSERDKSFKEREKVIAAYL